MRQGYEIRRIKEICKKGSSNVAQKDLKDCDGEYPIYGASGFIKKVNFFHQENECIGLVKDGAGVGRVLFLPPQSSVIGTLQYIKPNDGYNIRYVGYCLQSINLSKYSQGATIPHIYFKDYGEEQVVVTADMLEQQRIVDILDAEFAKIDALKENAEKQLQQTKALLRQQQNVTFTKQQSVPLQSMVEIINGYAFKSEDFDKSHTVKAIKITNVGVGTFVETDDTNLACCHLHDQKDFIAHSGDIVIALTRTIISDGLKVAIVPNSYNQALLNQRVALLRINDEILREYLYYYFQTTEVKKYVLGRVNELMQPNLSIKDLRAMPIPCCEREEMHKCVTNLKYFDELCNTLKSNYMKTIHLCNDLKQALLRKAFNGEL